MRLLGEFPNAFVDPRLKYIRGGGCVLRAQLRRAQPEEDKQSPDEPGHDRRFPEQA
jgi:hypothetical protein